MTKKELFDLLWEYPDDMQICRVDADWGHILITRAESYRSDRYDDIPTFYKNGNGYRVDEAVILLR